MLVVLCLPHIVGWEKGLAISPPELLQTPVPTSSPMSILWYPPACIRTRIHERPSIVLYLIQWLESGPRHHGLILICLIVAVVRIAQNIKWDRVILMVR